MRAQIAVDNAGIVDFCRQHHIRRLALFGSVLTESFGPDSDLDVLVCFEESHVPGLIRMAGLELALADLMGARKVDLRTPEDLSRYFRDTVLAQSEVLYEE